MKLLMGILAAAIAGSAQGETVLRYGQIPSSIRSVSSLQYQIAERQGFFAKQGLKIEPVPVEGGTDFMIQALDKGTVDITRTATPYLITAVTAGSDAVAIAEEVGNSIYSLIAKSDVTSFAALKGRAVGLSLAVDTISISTRKLIAMNGVDDTDYRVKELVGTPARLACLKSGECDAVPLGQPEDFEAIGAGYRRLGLSTDAVPESVMTVSAVRRGWGAQHKEAVTGFVRAFADAFRFIRDPANRATVIKTIVDSTGTSEAIARATLTLYYEPDRGVFPAAAEINLAGLATVIEFMAAAGQIKGALPPPERFVDLQYLAAAEMR
jgi:ABC-type nitrate/sulfonate/bicarbonate transport system substrate-binding protein